MSRNDLNMENLFREQMGSFRVDPSPGLWQKVHAKILWKQFFSFGFQSFNVYYLAAAIALGGLGTYAWISRPHTREPQPSVRTPVETEAGRPVQTSPDTVDLGQETMITVEAEPVEDKPGVPAREQAKKKDATSPRKETDEVPSLQPFEKKPETPDKSSVEAEPDSSKEKKSETLVVNVDFRASQVSGCSPLAVEFENLSENAETYNWTFGDGGSSTEPDPSYVFDEPGEYPVILKIQGKDGLEYSSQQAIRVFETPRAFFEMDEAADLGKNQPVYFYNYSRGAEYYEWDFGDQQRSSLTDPVHYYRQPGSYDVKLKVWNDHQCYDSLVILNAFADQEAAIQFPNAFTPNMTGPTGGEYERNDISNAVFHPVVSGELLEYQLKIFNRQGLQIFESNDVRIGWDGYYQEEPAAQAVYIWKARGKFSNGKTFVKGGDVTLIRQY